MQTTTQLKALRLSRNVLIIFFLPILFFYICLIVPEYLACDKILHDGEKGIDIWGSEIDCSCESKAFGEIFFQLFSIIIGGFSIALTTAIFFIRHLKENLR